MTWKCWYCGWPNEMNQWRCHHCGAERKNCNTILLVSKIVIDKFFEL